MPQADSPAAFLVFKQKSRDLIDLFNIKENRAECASDVRRFTLRDWYLCCC